MYRGKFPPECAGYIGNSERRWRKFIFRRAVEKKWVVDQVRVRGRGWLFKVGMFVRGCVTGLAMCNG